MDKMEILCEIERRIFTLKATAPFKGRAEHIRKLINRRIEYENYEMAIICDREDFEESNYLFDIKMEELDIKEKGGM